MTILAIIVFFFFFGPFLFLSFSFGFWDIHFEIYDSSWRECEVKTMINLFFCNSWTNILAFCTSISLLWLLSVWRWPTGHSTNPPSSCFAEMDNFFLKNNICTNSIPQLSKWLVFSDYIVSMNVTMSTSTSNFLSRKMSCMQQYILLTLEVNTLFVSKKISGIHQNHTLITSPGLS